MSLSPPSLENALPLGARVYFISRKRVVSETITGVSHHFSRVGRPSRECWIDARALSARFFRDRHTAELECAFRHRPGGDIARGLLDWAERNGGEVGPYSLGEIWMRTLHGDDDSPHEPEVRRGLRLLASLGHATWVPGRHGSRGWIIRSRWVESPPSTAPKQACAGNLPGDPLA